MAGVTGIFFILRCFREPRQSREDGMESGRDLFQSHEAVFQLETVVCK